MPHPIVFSHSHVSTVDLLNADAASLVNGNERWENEGGHIGPFLRVSLPLEHDLDSNSRDDRTKSGQSACSRYRLASSVAEVGAVFRVEGEAESNAAEFVLPGAPGLVIANGKVCSMSWGLPFTTAGRGTPQIATNAPADKLSSEFWRGSFNLRRCLVPLNAFEISQCMNGKTSQLWMAIKDQPMFACAGIWRDSDEWGPVFALVTTFRSDPSRPVRDGMPVILEPADYDIWLNGPIEDAKKLCIPFEKEIDISFSTGAWHS